MPSWGRTSVGFMSSLGKKLPTIRKEKPQPMPGLVSFLETETESESDLEVQLRA